jgi:ubiquinone/menaquinone biosynthesis C-methylase UbiE
LTEQEHIIKTFSEMATRYEDLMNSELTRFWGIDYYSFIQEVLGDIATDASVKILDIATGTAFIPRSFLKDGVDFSRITGLDITLEMLKNARRLSADLPRAKFVDFVCASAHEMPFKNNCFEIAVCCLATHHMSVDQLLAEIQIALAPGGKFYIGDVGGSSRWRIGIIRLIIKLFAFIYFLFTENYSRARSESEAVANVMTTQEWHDRISAKGFENISIREVKSSRFWTPNPVIIEATKKLEE